MRIQNINIDNIPAIIWGEQSNKVYIHVHGKMGCKEYAENFAEIAEEKGYQTLSFDLPEHGERTDNHYRCDIWNGIHDLRVIADYVFSKCIFHSPVLNMEYLIRQMFTWFDVTEEKLSIEKEISTSVDLLRWDYFQYVVKHPIGTWNIPTAILYGGRDNLQSLDVIEEFAKAHKCKLTISQGSEHPFTEVEDVAIVSSWLKDNI